MSWRHKWLALCSAFYIASISSIDLVHGQSPNSALKVLSTIKGGGGGRWDYITVDSAAGRLYVARGNRLQIFDLEKSTPVGDVVDLQGAHGAAIAGDKNLGFVTSGRENAIAVFDLKSLETRRKISTTPGGHGQNPDAILYDSGSQKVFAFCAGGDAVVLDPANLDAPLVSIFCGGKLEAGQSDGTGRVFVNCEDKNEVVVIDSKDLKVTDHWPLAPITAPTGLALDREHHRLFAVGANQKMAILDADSGKVLGTSPIGSGVDGCAFDSKLGIALSANGRDGTVTVVRETSPGTFAAIQTLATATTGRTITSDPKTSRFYIPATLPAEGDNAAQFGIVVVGPSP